MSRTLTFSHWLYEERHSAAFLTLNRPQIHNAMDDTTVIEAMAALNEAEESDRVRTVVISGAGESFCAGADINWMKRVRNFTKLENIRDAEALCEMFYRIYTFRKPVVAAVQGAARGGGTGLLAACDVVIASSNATFAFSEVKLGLVPAVISPYLVRRLGEGPCRYYILTGRKFDATEALRLGLVDAVVPPDELEDAVVDHVRELVANGPEAMATAKELIRAVGRTTPEEAKVTTSRMLARVRAEEEAVEGFSAFLEKRKPKWAGK
ncbi:MAG: enoyl-CoA hydratase/isomerase family protein [Candidatus Wallbacteria bacterium]|nr:enoyl-CoA hydratase/isomerase family protein [Candidatus Wallbacteria bacterium]